MNNIRGLVETYELWLSLVPPEKEDEQRERIRRIVSEELHRHNEIIKNLFKSPEKIEAKPAVRVSEKE